MPIARGKWKSNVAWAACVGCDPNIESFPKYLLGSASKFKAPDLLKKWGELVIHSLTGRCRVIKFQVAWFEAHGSNGYAVLEHLIDLAHEAEMMVICDIKRGDIGESNKAYAKAWFEYFKVDAITVNPWLGLDSLAPILSAAAKQEARVYMTLRTSNSHSDTIQGKIFQQLLRDSIAMNEFEDTLCFVIGADRRQEVKSLLHLHPAANILVPGFGFQSGSTENLVDFMPVRNTSSQESSYKVLFSASRSVTLLSGNHKDTLQSNDQFRNAICAQFDSFRDLLQKNI